MNLTKVINSRKLYQNPQKHFIGDTIIIGLIDTIITLDKTWEYNLNHNRFEAFITTYQFPQNPELTKKDNASYPQALFAPLFTIKKKNSKRSFGFCYLYDARTLKGNSNLHIRSIVKYELMWANYFVHSYDNTEVKVTRIKREQFDVALSSRYKFKYNDTFVQDLELNLQILAIEVQDKILLFYFVDDTDNHINASDIQQFLASIEIGGSS